MRRWLLLPDPFVVALLATLALATVLPARGASAVLVNCLATGLIVLLFFFHGAKLSRSAIVDGIRHWRLHIVILTSTFVMFPILGVLLSSLFPQLLPRALWLGILYLAALPSTVQSSIAFTSMAQGNVPAAIASASASQVPGVFLTPPLVALLGGVRGGHLPLAGLGLLVLQVLVPFVLGHLLRPWLGAWVQRYKTAISITDRGAILAAVYSAFSAGVIEGIWRRLELPTLATLLTLCSGMLAFALLFTWGAGGLFGFSRRDRIAILFCGTKKSLVQGVPIARALFAATDVGLVLLPIMIFHQLQLTACAFISRRYANGQTSGSHRDP
jgi:sodium/bile acid cotransporter 7